MSSDTRTSAADSSDDIDNGDGPEKALDLMREALRLLDESQGPHDVRAHLDLAINRLELSIDKSKGSGKSSGDRS